MDLLFFVLVHHVHDRYGNRLRAGMLEELKAQGYYEFCRAQMNAEKEKLTFKMQPAKNASRRLPAGTGSSVCGTRFAFAHAGASFFFFTFSFGFFVLSTLRVCGRIDLLGQLGEFDVGFLLFVQGFFQNRSGFVFSQLLGPTVNATIGGDFIMLYALRG